MGATPDLRVVKTRAAIRQAFDELLCEADYGHITVKELAARARINRKTFYAHYATIDALFDELVDEMAAPFVRREVSYSSPGDVEGIVRVFFVEAESQSPAHRRIICSDSYRPVFDRVNRTIMEHRRLQNAGAFGLSPAEENIVFAYFGSVTPTIYRQWVRDGRRLPLDDVIELAVRLICRGMGSLGIERG